MNFEELRKLKRINIIGTSGSGKSTFAREVASLLKLPYYEMDQLFWKPHWQKPSDEEFFAKVQNVTSGQEWVLDGNYNRTTPEKWKHVELVLWLDLSFARTVLRVTKRAICRSLTRDELWPGTQNRESLAKAFLSKESIIWWAITSYRRNRKRYSAMMRAPEYAHISFVRLRGPVEMTSFLDRVRLALKQSNQVASVSSRASGPEW